MCFYFDTSVIQNVKVIGPKLGRVTPNGTRDGDGDGKCKEENGKFIPCPPGAADGTIFNINKITGDMRAVGNIGTPIGQRNNNEIADATDWMQVARDKFEKAKKDRKEKRQKVLDQANEEGLTGRQQRVLDRFRMDDYRRRDQEDNDNLLAYWDRENDSPKAQDYANPDDYNEAVDQWQTDRDDYEYELQNNLDNEADGEDFDTLFTYEITGTDGQTYRVETLDTQVGEDGVAIYGAIHNEADEEIGHFERLFNGNQVEHQSFQIDDDYQGLGIGSAVNARNEMLYKEMGIELIVTHGVSGTGFEGYAGMKGATHWPKNGFTWQNKRDKERFIESIEKAIDEYKAGNFALFESPEQAQIMKELCEAAKQEQFDYPNTIHPADLLAWPGAEKYFKDNRLDFYYKRKVQ